MDDIEISSKLYEMAEGVKSVIEYLKSPVVGYNPVFMEPALESLWHRYFILKLHAIKTDPVYNHLNQGERAQRIQAEMKNFLLTQKNETTIRAWEQLKTKDLIQENSDSLRKKALETHK